MPLLRNSDVRVHPRCPRTVLVWAAIEGPYHRPRNWWPLVFAVVYAAAAVVIAMDLFVWRPW